MISSARSATGHTTSAFVSWLVTGAAGPALVALPVNIAADKLAAAAVRWFRRLRQTDDLSRLMTAATGASIQLDRTETKDLRKLLEDEETWRQLAGRDVTLLSDRIAGCLPARDGRTVDDARRAAEAIARGLFEFAIFDLQPDVFQKVVLARLQQMTDQATALDVVLFRMHKDLYAFAEEAKALFRHVMDQLPPGPADLNEVRIYLKTLIGWLNTDPWPQGHRLGGLVLTQAMIERKLRVIVTGSAREQEADADDLARQSSRLVILGMPGSGKTWLARRIARRCAEDALAALDAGAALDEVELPLYTTCSRLVTALGSIREAAASSAIERIGDLGDSRIIKALRLSFTERDRPTCLVIDSLDEAGDTGEARHRLREADSLMPPWRVVLTSRPSSWDNQLAIREGGLDQRVGELQPLRYPRDIEAVIQHWFAGAPGRGLALAAQIARRPSLQQAATVPLILAFYCILGSDHPLPEHRHELYEQVIKRMLHGPWRSGSQPPPDADACRAALRTWAWQGAANHAVTGIGQWDDDVPTQHAQLSPAGQDAVGHIAAPQGGTDFDNQTLRRFVHRSIREHLVAEHVATLPAAQAVKILLPHLWFDPDWEYAAPAAIAMHPEHNEVLRDLLRRSCGSAEIPSDLSTIDARGEMCKLLSRVAAESKEDGWSPEVAAIIGQARVDLARAGVIFDGGETAGWPTSNAQIRQIALGQLTGDIPHWEATWWAERLAQLGPTPGDKHQAVEELLRRLGHVTSGRDAENLAHALAGLDPAPADQRRALDMLLTRLADNPPDDYLTDALLVLKPSSDDKQLALAALLARLADPEYFPLDRMNFRTWERVPVTDVLARLAATTVDIRQARDTLLERLASQDHGWAAANVVAALICLDPAPEARREILDVSLGVLVSRVTAFDADSLAEAVLDLAQSEEDKRHVLSMLIRALTRQEMMNQAARRLIVQLGPGAAEKRQAVDALLVLLARSTGPDAAELADLIARLDPTADEKHRACQVLVEQLTTRVRDTETETRVAADLVAALFRLDPTPDDKRLAREALLLGLPNLAADGIRSQVRELVILLFGQNSSPAADLAAAFLQLDPTPGDRRRARHILLSLLSGQDRAGLAADLAAMVAQLDPEPNEKRQVHDAILARLAEDTNGLYVERLAGALVQLDPTPDNNRQACRTLIGLLRGTAASSAAKVMAGLSRLNATPDDMRQAREAAREALLVKIGSGPRATVCEGGRPRRPPHGTVANEVKAVLQVASTAEERRQALDGLLGLLARETDSHVAAELINGVAQLGPTACDLSSWRTWAAPPTAELLAAARRNSALDAWLAVLPSLRELS